jgi:hypothetical protein
MVTFSAEVGDNSSSAYAQYSFTDGTNNFGNGTTNANVTASATNDGYVSVSNTAVITVGSGGITLEIEYANSTSFGGYKAYIRNANITALAVN